MSRHERLCLIACGCALLAPAAVRCQGSSGAIPTPARPITSQSPDFTLKVDQPYCDFSLPYAYWDLRDGTRADAALLKVEMQVRPEWLKTFQGQLDGLSGSNKDHLKLVVQGTAPESGSTLVDAGGPLLGVPGKEFSRDGHKLQQLVVRSLYGPGLFSNACSADYLDGAPAVSGPPAVVVAQPNQPPYSFTHQPAPDKPNDNLAPEYYLVNIVRWLRTKEGAYQVSSDEWYVWNYSDDQAWKREAPGIFGKRFRSMMQDDLRLIGSKRVMFLAVHLAPSALTEIPTPTTGDLQFFQSSQAAVNSAPAEMIERTALGVTDPGWYGGAISYKIHADKLEPANYQDFDLLFQIVTGVPAAAPQAAAGGGTLSSRAADPDQQAREKAQAMLTALTDRAKRQPVLYFYLYDALSALNDVLNSPTPSKLIEGVGEVERRVGDAFALPGTLRRSGADERCGTAGEADVDAAARAGRRQADSRRFKGHRRSHHCQWRQQAGERRSDQACSGRSSAQRQGRDGCAADLCFASRTQG